MRVLARGSSARVSVDLSQDSCYLSSGLVPSNMLLEHAREVMLVPDSCRLSASQPLSLSAEGSNTRTRPIVDFFPPPSVPFRPLLVLWEGARSGRGEEFVKGFE